MSDRKEHGPGIVSIATSEAGDVAEMARSAGQLVYTLPNSGVEGREELFDAARQRLPLAPPLGVGGKPKWDALSDSLFGGLVEVNHDRLTII
jgi:hypothetical protein